MLRRTPRPGRAGRPGTGGRCIGGVVHGRCSCGRSRGHGKGSVDVGPDGDQGDFTQGEGADDLRGAGHDPAVDPGRAALVEVLDLARVAADGELPGEPVRRRGGDFFDLVRLAVERARDFDPGPGQFHGRRAEGPGDVVVAQERDALGGDRQPGEVDDDGPRAEPVEQHRPAGVGEPGHAFGAAAASVAGPPAMRAVSGGGAELGGYTPFHSSPSTGSRAGIMR